MKLIRLANIRNGLAYPHDDVCCFLSAHAHHAGQGYFRDDAMPYAAALRLMQGGEIEIIDATQHDKPLSDALRFGVPTWCRVFNRAVAGSYNHVQVCDWETSSIRVAANSKYHRPLVQVYRKLIAIYGVVQPAVIGRNVHLVCHRKVDFDDRPEVLKQYIQTAGSQAEASAARRRD